METHFKNVFVVTNVGKYRSFQYRLLHSAIVTNEYLKRCRIVNDNWCTFCDETTETIEHLLWQCYHVQTFWNNVRQFINEILPDLLQLHFSLYTIMMNKVHDKANHVANFIVLGAKQFIYRMRCAKSRPNFHMFKRIVYTVENSYRKREGKCIGEGLSKVKATKESLSPLLCCGYGREYFPLPSTL